MTTKTKTEAPTTAATETDLPRDAIAPDPDNRIIDETSDRFLGLLDSIRLIGIQDRLHVQRQADGTFMLRDGERRWRAATQLGLATVPCKIWPEHASLEVITATVAREETKEPPGCVHVARVLTQIKNRHDLSAEEIAARTGMPLPRVKLYLSLFNASDRMLKFFDEAQLQLALAAEFMRYEKHCGEVSGRRLIERHQESPLSVRDVAALRAKARSRKEAAEAGDSEAGTDDSGGGGAASSRRKSWGTRLTAAWQKEPEATRKELEQALGALGFRLVAVESGV